MLQAMNLIKKSYEKELLPMGYIKIKSKHPYFIKMLTPEIFATISIEKEKYISMRFNGNVGQVLTGYGEFHVYCGIGTIYRQEIDFSKDLEDNKYWLIDVKEIYYNDNIDLYGKNYSEKFKFYYKKEDKESIVDAVKKSIDVIKEYTFDRFEEIDSLEKVIKYYEKYHYSLLYIGENDEPGCDYCQVVDEGLIQILLNNHDNFKDMYNHEREKYYYMTISPITGLTMEDYEKFCKKLEEDRNSKVRNRDIVLNNPEIRERVLEELENRKIKNIEVLKSVGIQI